MEKHHWKKIVDQVILLLKTFNNTFLSLVVFEISYFEVFDYFTIIYHINPRIKGFFHID